MKSWHYDRTGLSGFMDRYQQDRLGEPENEEQCYWCEDYYPESELEEIDDVLLCQGCQSEYEELLDE